jgi:hypothetical protein
MKYILKKDLPFIKAGAEVESSISEGCIPVAIFKNNITVSKEYLIQLISDGWLEEVKPREWKINIGTDGAAIFQDNEILLKFGRIDTPLIKSIKVREVIE